MSLPAIDPRDADRIERALDGLLPHAELEVLKADIVRNPALRAAYVDRVWVHSLLRADRERLASLVATDDADAELKREPAEVLHSSRWPLVLGVVGAAAACGALLFSALRPVPPSPAAMAAARPAPIAVLTQAQNTKWAGSTLPTAEKSELGAGTLALLEGIATVRFASGATVTLEAPTKFELVDAMRTRLIEGSITAEVPSAAKGFTVETADFSVVDLGTRFGVTASSTGNAHVFVFEGEVKLDDPEGMEMRRLTAGKAFNKQSGPVGAGNSEPSRLPPLEQIGGWTSISTAFGRGKDGFARRGSQIVEPQALLMVKHSDIPLSFKNERRAIVTFDLSEVKPASIDEAELVLDPEPSGLGFATMVPDSRFAIYGVIDETFDTWGETTLSWGSGPAHSDELNPSQVTRLAEFALPRGGSGAPLAVRGAAFRDFLRGDTNGLATFVIVRETSETDPSGLVHAFASKEHPTAQPPTLRLRQAP
ncbi:MAG TPA: FecR domain-containing protein [Opitutaceae bacterium]